MTREIANRSLRDFPIRRIIRTDAMRVERENLFDQISTLSDVGSQPVPGCSQQSVVVERTCELKRQVERHYDGIPRCAVSHRCIRENSPLGGACAPRT